MSLSAWPIAVAQRSSCRQIREGQELVKGSAFPRREGGAAAVCDLGHNAFDGVDDWWSSEQTIVMSAAA